MCHIPAGSAAAGKGPCLTQRQGAKPNRCPQGASHLVPAEGRLCGRERILWTGESRLLNPSLGGERTAVEMGESERLRPGTNILLTCLGVWGMAGHGPD